MLRELGDAASGHAKDIAQFAGVAASLFIGIRNWRTTSKIRAATIRLDEFRSQIRDPIIDSLKSVSKVREGLVALSKPNALTDTDLISEVGTQQATFEFVVLDLADLLDHADRSEFARGKGWKATFGGRFDAASKDIEAITARQPINRVQVGLQIGRTVSSIAKLSSDLKEALEREVRESLPR